MRVALSVVGILALVRALRADALERLQVQHARLARRVAVADVVVDGELRRTVVEAEPRRRVVVEVERLAVAELEGADLGVAFPVRQGVGDAVVVLACALEAVARVAFRARVIAIRNGEGGGEDVGVGC